MIGRYMKGQTAGLIGEPIPTYAESLPLDPFTGKDFLYKHDEIGYMVYSVGDDQKDDGGQLEHKTEDKTPSDWGIRVRRPPK